MPPRAPLSFLLVSIIVFTILVNITNFQTAPIILIHAVFRIQKYNEDLARVLSTLDSYSGDHGFEISPGYRLTRLKFSSVHRRDFKVVHDFFVSCKFALVVSCFMCSRAVIRLYRPVNCVIGANVSMEWFNELMPWGSNWDRSAAVCYISETIEPNHAANYVQSMQSSWPLRMQLGRVMLLPYAWIHTSLNPNVKLYNISLWYCTCKVREPDSFFRS
jgi:hypothetical protein